MLTNLRPIQLLLLLLFIVCAVAWFAFLRQGNLDGTDYYPLYFAARQLLQGQSPYGAQATSELVQFW